MCALSAEPGRKTGYSCDIGWRVVWQRLSLELTFEQIGKRLQIAPSTAHRIFSRFSDTGEVAPFEQSAREDLRKLDGHHELLIMGMVHENPCLYLREICQAIYEATRVVVSGSTVCRVLHRLGYSRKKVQQIANQRCLEFRSAFMAQVLQFPREMFVWVDETGSDARTHIRRFGYSLRSLPPIYNRRLVRGKRISAIAAISCEGLVGVDLEMNSVNSDKFIDFIRGTLIPEMQPFDGSNSKSILIMDNCSIHHVGPVQELLQDAGILVIFLPPYSPDLNPIEETFSSVKYYLKNHDEILQSVTDSDAITIVQAAFQNITKEQCISWITDCGYH